MTKILVADDEEDVKMLICQRFRRKIRENKYQFIFVLNGEEALEVLRNNKDINVVICDINMPVMDGLTFLNRLHDNNLLVKAIILSAYGDIENSREAMNRGAFDFIYKPIDFQNLEIIIEKTILYVNQVKEKITYNEKQ